MTQLPGYEDSKFPSYICKLERSLYGLKQAPRAWNTKINAFLVKIGFQTSSANPYLYSLVTKRELILLVLYVDDVIITGTS